MELVIRIDEHDYKDFCIQAKLCGNALRETQEGRLRYAIANGIVLPKGRGRLIDENAIVSVTLEDSVTKITHNKGDEVDCYIDAPTVIEADKNSMSITPPHKGAWF